jgi:alpha-galactosidase
MAQGIEDDNAVKPDRNTPDASVSRVVSIPDQHQRLLAVGLFDQTDHYNELVHTRQWLLHHRELPLDLQGNLFIMERPLTGAGTILVKQAPLPPARPVEGSLIDLTVRPNPDGPGYEYLLHQTGPDDLEAWHVIEYDGGEIGRTIALHRWQRSARPATDAHRIPRLISNTWGDRNRDGRMQHDFVLREIDRAAELGVDIVQLDDGWQRGASANSIQAKQEGGIWTGFWESDPQFWTPHPQRFPHGFGPIFEHAKNNGIGIGLWYVPDSSNDYANWQKDVDQILTLHRQWGVQRFKLDGIDAGTHEARRNLSALFDAIMTESSGRIACDLDLTGGGSKRPGYFGALGLGPIFLENRYTDWHGYWPHQTLRNLWQLSHWIDPQRLRIEFLNNERNAEKYPDDPLAPVLYPPATLFAITMFANPLGWFENTGLSDAYRAQVAPLIQCWRDHRERIASGHILPIGHLPDGTTWTGFCSLTNDSPNAYAVIFNQASPKGEATLGLPRAFTDVAILHGQGTAQVKGNQLTATMPRPFGYSFVQLTGH